MLEYDWILWSQNRHIFTHSPIESILGSDCCANITIKAFLNLNSINIKNLNINWSVSIRVNIFASYVCAIGAELRFSHWYQYCGLKDFAQRNWSAKKSTEERSHMTIASMRTTMPSLSIPLNFWPIIQSIFEN